MIQLTTAALKTTSPGRLLHEYQEDSVDRNRRNHCVQEYGDGAFTSDIREGTSVLYPGRLACQQNRCGTAIQPGQYECVLGAVADAGRPDP